MNDDLDVLAHDDMYIYLAAYPNNAPIENVSSDDQEADIAAPPTSEKSSVYHLAQFLNKEAFPVKISSQIQYLGRIGSLLNPAGLPVHHQALNGKIPDGYTSPQKMRSFFEKIALQNPDFVSWVDLGRTFATNLTSIEGRPVNALRINVQSDPAQHKPSVLFASCHHARELITPEIAIAIADVLTAGYQQGDVHISKWLKEYDIWIVPVVNVDGHEFVWSTDNMWRKNRRQLREKSAGRPAAFGVDLNRNYDLGWDSQGGSQEFESETYRGAAPFSEPETQIMKAFSERMHFAKVMDFHSSGQQVLVHYTRTKMPEIMTRFIAAEGKELAETAKYGVRSPSDDAEHQEWQIKRNTAYSFLVETGTSFQPPFPVALQEVRRVWPAVVTFLERPITLRGRVTDASGAPVPNANIVVKQVEWLAGETRNSNPSTGTYHLFLPHGEYDIEVSAQGFSGEVRKVVVSEDSQVVDFVLQSS